MPICKGARVKIKRAEHHIAELETCINGLRKRLVVSAHIDAKSGCEFIQCGFAGIKESEIIEDISAIIGDAIHNLRCALDHVWIDTITL